MVVNVRSLLNELYEACAFQNYNDMSGDLSKNLNSRNIDNRAFNEVPNCAVNRSTVCAMPLLSRIYNFRILISLKSNKPRGAVANMNLIKRALL